MKTQSILKIILAVGIIVLLIFPFSALGLNILQLFVNEKIVIDIRYLIAGLLFLIFLLISFLSKKDSSDIISTLLFTSILIILSAQGFMHPIIAVVIIGTDIIFKELKNVLKVNSLYQIKNVCLSLGILLTLFYNLPFELFNLRVADFMLILSSALSVISLIQYSK